MMARRPARTRKQFHQQPMAGADYWPPIMVLLTSFMALWPVISFRGWWPDLALLVLIAWRLQRPLAFKPWFAPVAGIFNDLVSGHPIGLSVFTFSLAMIAAELIERRRQWQDYATEWLVASILIAISEMVQWQVARLGGADLPVAAMGVPILVSVLLFPLIATLVRWTDAIRLRSR
ncbi:rod shape-determining protein MreD [Sphingomicrobium flavum]|uniref:rod shape-determining protein MreD n=1 Tax=Sphingomicrobium flavum TaxID=1229164 RepID=UPI0021AE0A9D|nr:rod shape-determining protein MreD [Sphingomicrobium flavum]